MAKKAAAKEGKPLAGKRVAFVGKFTYWQDKHREEWVRSAGGQVVPPSGAVDVLVYGEGRGGKPPGDVAKIEKRLPGVVTLPFAELAKLVLPDPTELVATLKRGRPSYEYWDVFQTMTYAAGGSYDLRGTDFRGADLHGAKLGWALLSGADCTGTDCEYADLATTHPIEGAKFDGAKLYAATLRVVKGCSFRKADLKQTWADSTTYEACDFRDATMPRVRGHHSTFTDCDFRGAALPDADLQGAGFVRCDFTKADLSRLHANKARFADAKLAHANLTRADLRETSLKGADLRNANLRDAALGGTDLTGANVAGADFAGAVLTGAKLTGVDFSKAKNYTPPAVRKAGPKVKEFAAAAAGAQDFSTSAEVELGEGEHASLWLRVGKHGISAASRYYRHGDDAHDWITAPTVEQGLLNMADRWPNASLRLDAVKAKGSPTVRGAKLQALAVAAWAEAFGVSLAAADDLEAQKRSQHDEATRRRDELMAKIRKKGPSVWRALDYRERARFDLRGIDLSGANLSAIELTSRQLQGSRFTDSDLTAAKLYSSELQGADFGGADLTGADLQYSKCEKASFAKATLTNADLSNTKLQGADFTGATLAGAKLGKAQFDGHTKFPAGFKVPDAMVWKGDGPRPGLRAAKVAAPGSMTFGAFVKGLVKKVDPARIQKAAAMLKAERFQLFADVTDSALAGVVKSQTSKELVYSCRLAADGAFGCGTQNLKPCGGLQGALCKHLLVLVVGLAKAGKLDPATADNWVNASRGQKPTLDTDVTAATFLKYKGAEAGEIDWRPTETIPEDFYAM